MNRESSQLVVFERKCLSHPVKAKSVTEEQAKDGGHGPLITNRLWISALGYH